MWASPPHRPARASAARQHRERPRPTPPLSRRGRRCLPFDRVWPSSVFSSAALRTYPSAAGRLSPGTSRQCRSGGIPRLRGQHQRPDGGSVATGQPAARQRPASSLPSRHARAREAPTARAAMSRTYRNPNHAPCRLAPLETFGNELAENGLAVRVQPHHEPKCGRESTTVSAVFASRCC